MERFRYVNIRINAIIARYSIHTTPSTFQSKFDERWFYGVANRPTNCSLLENSIQQPIGKYKHLRYT